MKKRIAIGVSDFREMQTEAYYYVDKSLFIKEIMDDGSKVILLPRPRRFGKTLNLSMLRYFFEKSVQDNKPLFDDLAIGQDSDCMAKQGRYPVVYLSFKDAKAENWDQMYNKMVGLIIREYDRHYSCNGLRNSANLSEADKRYIGRILEASASLSEYERSIHMLTEFLTRH